MAERNESGAGADSPSFEEALARLEQVVHRLEDGELGLAEALAQYEQGVRMLKQCHGLLEQAERRIELLTGVDAAGNPILQPFSEGAEQGEAAEKRSGKSKARSGGRKSRTPEPAEPAQPTEPANEGSPDPEFDVDAPGSLF